ncbi:PREDICTED: tumor necrosis factor receptor superfamily member 8 [Dipodomys ordii]|uniref:Tumor necrosis factor receptor superfamily member 8 n=1 Tax=Dipodomys ordii TaxID=10020 RepID=A0A1S3GH65_DIPOR|nr:PREDICTED: tumor necrosis factor receptor superfamily member 8 [Dipodomys ordii]
MRALLPAVPLLLLGTLRAFPQELSQKSSCAGDPSFYHDQASGKCCYRCPSGWSQLRPCPQRSADCRKQCEPDYYLNEAGRCTACVSCLRDDLVEKAPCVGNSSRVCECRPGMFCTTSATNSCARCSPHSVCPAGWVVQVPGTAEKDTVCQQPPLPGSSDTNPQDSKTPTSSAPPAAARTSHPWRSSALRLGGTASLARTPRSQPGMAERDTTLEPLPLGTSPDYSTPQNSKTPASTTLSPLLESKTSRTVLISTRSLPSTRKPILNAAVKWKRRGSAASGQYLTLYVGGSLLLPRELCGVLWALLRGYKPPTLPRGSLQALNQDGRRHSDDARPARTLSESTRISVTEFGPGSLSTASPPAVELSPPVGAACLESLPLLDASLAEGPSVPRDSLEPRVSTEHTNNRIEKIYIMKADTVIVGTVKTEVPESRGLGGPGEPELEVDHAPHFPEQETEPPPGSGEDVMFSVEEEGKEDSGPMTMSGK